jgi:hypothetical protein
MLLPRVLYGRDADVRARALGLMPAIERGERSVADSVPADTEPEGLIVLQGGSPLLAEVDAHQVWALHAHLGARSPQADAILEESLSTPWGVLALLGQDTQAWILPPERHRAFLEALLEHHEAISELDGQFTLGEPTGSALWGLPTNVQYVLAQRGVEPQALLDPLPSGGWVDLVQRACAAERS